MFYEVSSVGAVMSLRSVVSSMRCTRNRRRSAALSLGQGAGDTSATGFFRISAAIALDSRLISQLSWTRQALQSKPSRLPLEIEYLSMREPLQRRAKSALRTPCALGDPAQLAVIPGEKTDHQVRLFERIGSQDDGFAYASRHIGVTDFQVSTTGRKAEGKCGRRVEAAARRNSNSPASNNRPRR